MKSKKFVLAALALLAITGLLALAGCKTEVDTSSPQQEEPKVTVEAETPPTLGVRVFNATDAGLKIQLPSSFVDGSRLPFLWGGRGSPQHRCPQDCVYPCLVALALGLPWYEGESTVNLLF